MSQRNATASLRIPSRRKLVLERLEPRLVLATWADGGTDSFGDLTAIGEDGEKGAPLLAAGSAYANNIQMSIHGRGGQYLQLGLDRVTRTKAVSLLFEGELANVASVEFLLNNQASGGPISFAAELDLAFDFVSGWNLLTANFYDSSAGFLDSNSIDVFYADLGEGQLTFSDPFEGMNGESHSRRLYDNMPLGVSATTPWNGYSEIAISNENKYSGENSLKHVFSFDAGASDTGKHILYHGHSAGDDLRDANTILSKSLPHGKIRIDVTEMQNARIGLRPGGHDSKTTVFLNEATEGWITLDLSMLLVNAEANDTDVARFLVSVIPAEGYTTLAGASGTFYLDDYEVWATAENDAWVADLDDIAANEDRDGYSGEATAHIGDNGVEGSITLGAVAGEPESFSVTLDPTLDLRTLYPTVADFVADGSGAVLPYDLFDIKWVANWNLFKFNDPTRAGQDIIIEDASELQAIDLADGLSEKFWVSFTTPENQLPGVYRSSLTVSHETGFYEIPITLEVYDLEIDAASTIDVGLYVLGTYRGSPEMLEWLNEAGVSNTTYYQGPNVNQVTSETTNLNIDNLKAEVAGRQAAGFDAQDLYLLRLLNHEQWRYLFGGDDKYTLGEWIGFSVQAKLDLANLELPSDANKWLYSWDESQGDKLFVQAPLWEIGKNSGYQWQAAIHTEYYFQHIDPNVTYPGSEAWSHYTASYGDTVGQYIDHWLTTERSYAFSKLLESQGQRASTYGYPFTDVDGYSVHRHEFWRSMMSGNYSYFNYAFDDFQGAPLGSGRKMGLVINTPSGIIDGESAEGFVRGYWDMRYFQTIVALLNHAEESGFQGPVVEGAKQFVEIVNEDAGWFHIKTDMVEQIRALKGLLADTPHIDGLQVDGSAGEIVFAHAGEIADLAAAGEVVAVGDHLDSVAIEFSSDLSAAIDVSDFELRELATSQPVDLASVSMVYDLPEDRAILDLTSLVLPTGDYQFSMLSSTIQDSNGSTIDGNGDGVAGGDLELVVRISPAADFDLDNNVDGADFMSWQLGSGIQGQANKTDGDANNDSSVDVVDLNEWQDLYGDSPIGNFASVQGVEESAASVSVPDEPQVGFASPRQDHAIDVLLWENQLWWVDPDYDSSAPALPSLAAASPFANPIQPQRHPDHIYWDWIASGDYMTADGVSFIQSASRLQEDVVDYHFSAESTVGAQEFDPAVEDGLLSDT